MSIHTNVHHYDYEQPRVEVRDHRTPARRVVTVRRPVEVVRDHRDWNWDRDRYRPVVVQQTPVVYQPTWVEPVYTPPSYTYVPQAIQIQGATGLVSELALNNLSSELAGRSTLSITESGRGSTYLGSIYIYYTNGSSQTINPNTTLSAGNRCYDLPLGNGGDIARIIIDGQSNWNGSIAITAR
jgi:hypothetical protein